MPKEPFLTRREQSEPFFTPGAGKRHELTPEQRASPKTFWWGLFVLLVGPWLLWMLLPTVFAFWRNILSL